MRLPAGKVTLRLRGGGEARRTLRVAAQPLKVLSLSAPERVARGTKRVTLRIPVTAAATMTVGGRRTRLARARTRSPSARPARPATGVLRIPVRLGQTSAELFVTRA